MNTNETKRKYEKPTSRTIELQHRTMILYGSPTGINVDPTYNPFNEEKEW